MTLSSKDFEDLRLARPVPVLDLFDLDSRIDRLERIAERLERSIVGLGELYREERVRNWEQILQEMLRQYELKKGNRDGRSFR